MSAPFGTIRLKVIEEPGDAIKWTGLLQTMLNDFISGAGIIVVDADSSTFDADLEISVKATALSASYYSFGFGGATYYSGAKVSGRILYERASGKVLIEEAWTGEIQPPQTIVRGNYRPSDAPFQEAVNKSNLWSKLGTLIQHGFGSGMAARYWEAVVEDHHVRETAFRSLSSMGVSATPILLYMISKSLHVTHAESALQRIGTPALPEILTALKYEDAAMRQSVARMLKAITGQDFGLNPDAWQKWWDAQPKEATAK